MAATFSWQSTSGGYFDQSANWQLTSGSSSLGYPGQTDTATFTGVGGPIYTNAPGQVDTLNFVTAGWLLLGQITANTTSIVNGSVLTVGGGAQFVVNNALAVNGGATVNVALGTLAVTGTSAPAVFGGTGLGVLNVTSRGIASFAGPVTFGTGGGTGSVSVDAGVLTVGGVLQLGSGSPGSNGSLSISDAGTLLLNGATDASQSYLQLGASAGTAGFLQVNGAESLLSVTNNGTAVGLAGSGSLNVVGGATATFRSGNNGLSPAFNVGTLAGGSGAVRVSGTGSTLAANGSIRVGVNGRGTLQVSSGGTATSAALTAAQAALAVSAGSGSGSISIDGAGSSLTANGIAVIGGDNRGAGLVAGGAGTVAVTNGGTFQSGTLNIEAGSGVSVDGASLESVYGDVNLLGTLASSGTLSVSGAIYGSGSLQLGGGLASVTVLSSANIAFTGPNATLRVSTLTGTSSISGMQYGDQIDLVGNSAVRLSGNSVVTTAGSLALAPAAAGSVYELTSDGNGGTFVSLTADTVGVFRFFDTNYGTHFFTGSTSERNTIQATRPDLVYEGVGLQAVDPASNDPNSAPVFRFFDTTYGTHFFTASASERDAVIASRPDLTYEGVGFLEHTQQQAGDVPVYRFFDTHYGTHFYTDDASERATIVATRPDLAYEGIGFYAPS